MATRRKYKSRPDPPDQTNVAVGPAQASPVAPGATADADGANPFQRALEAQTHAENLQRQHQHRQQIGLPEPPVIPAERAAIDQFVESIPNLSDHQKRFLKAHPTLMKEPYVDLMRHAILVAKHAGIEPDTDAMDHAILDSIAADIQRHHHLKQLTSASARPTPQNAAMHQDVDRHVADLESEAEQHMAEHRPAPSAPPLPKRRSMPMSAPVSRPYVPVSGRPALDNHLTAEERVIARNSFSDPHMSNEQRELLYLRNRNKYRAAKADGSYSDQGRG